MEGGNIRGIMGKDHGGGGIEGGAWRGSQVCVGGAII